MEAVNAVKTAAHNSVSSGGNAVHQSALRVANNYGPATEYACGVYHGFDNDEYTNLLVKSLVYQAALETANSAADLSDGQQAYDAVSSKSQQIIDSVTYGVTMPLHAGISQLRESYFFGYDADSDGIPEISPEPSPTPSYTDDIYSDPFENDHVVNEAGPEADVRLVSEYSSSYTYGFTKYSNSVESYIAMINSGYDYSTFSDFFLNLPEFHARLFTDSNNRIYAKLNTFSESLNAVFPTPYNVCKVANAAAVDPAIHEDKVTGINAALGLILDAAHQLSAVSTDQNINCDSFSTDFNEAESHGILGAVDSAAQSIITTADKELAGIDDIIIFIQNFQSAHPPTIENFYVQPAYISSSTPPTTTLRSSTFKVYIRAKDIDDDLDKFEIIIADPYTNPANPRVELQRPSFSFGDATICSPPGITQTCEVLVSVDTDNVFIPNPGSDLKVNLIVRVKDQDVSTPQATETLNELVIPLQTSPVIKSFEIVSMDHVALGEYYTQFVVKVNATQTDGDLTGITLELPSELVTGLNSHLNSNPAFSQVQFENHLENNVGFFDYATNNPPQSPTRPNSNVFPSGLELPCSVVDVDGVPTCSKEFTIIASGELNEKAIVLSAKAHSLGNGDSEHANKKIRIPPESIPGCQYLDIGKSKNRYDLKLIYAWAESPGIFHTVTGTMLANSPE